MQKIIPLSLVLVLLISACKKNENDNNLTPSIDNVQIVKNYTSPLSWSNLKDKFPNENVSEFNFDLHSEPVFNAKNPVQLDSLTKKDLVKSIKFYSNWEHD